MTERRADEASRFVEQWLKAHYMKDHIGEAFDAVVTTVTNFGLFVTLTDLFIDGLIHISHLGEDYFVYDDKAQQLFGEKSGLVFGLGDKIRVKVAAVNMETQQIDFDLVAQLEKSSFNNRGKGKSRGQLQAASNSKAQSNPNAPSNPNAQSKPNENVRKAKSAKNKSNARNKFANEKRAIQFALFYRSEKYLLKHRTPLPT